MRRWSSCSNSTSLILGSQFSALEGLVLYSLLSWQTGSRLPSFSLLPVCISSTLFFSSAGNSAVWRFLQAALHVSSLTNACLFHVYSNLFILVYLVILLPASELELILMLAPSSLILMINAEKFLPTVMSKVILRILHFKPFQSIQFIFICIYICICIPDEPTINVTANKKSTFFLQVHSGKSKKPLDNS